MNDTVSFFIYTEPTAKARPRFTRYGRAYTPKKTADYEKQIAEYYKTMPKSQYFDQGTALKVSIGFCMPIPKSYSKTKRKAILEGKEHHLKKPDLDNMAKAVLDALNTVAWADDSQIVSLNLRKSYGENPHIWVSITAVNEEMF